MRDRKETQEKILHILLTTPDSVNALVAHRIGPEHFDPIFRPLLHGIFHAQSKGAKLTEVGYIDFIEKAVTSGKYSEWVGKKVDSPKQAVLREKAMLFEAFGLQTAETDDIEVYIDRLNEDRIREQSERLFQKFKEDAKKNYPEAIGQLSEGLEKISVSTSENKSNWVYLNEDKESFVGKLRAERENPSERLLTGISELDDSITVGLQPGSLTLFVADVGGFKSTMMLNVALNVWRKYHKDVLFISLEMPADMLEAKIAARETGIANEKLSKPELLTDANLERIEKEWDNFHSMPHRFVIEDTEERLKVSDIKAKIEKHISFFKPRLVVIDYITILSPEKSFANKASHEWVGHWCKDLRQLGRKHGFAIISAAQLGREAIKRLRSQKEGKQTVGSDDLRGSHDFSADSDNIYALVPDPSQPLQQLQLFCIKARYGKKTFKGVNRAVLNVNPDLCRISGATDAAWSSDDFDDGSDDAEFIKRQESASTGMSFEDQDDLDLDGDPSPSVVTKKPKKEKKKKSTGTLEFDEFD